MFAQRGSFCSRSTAALLAATLVLLLVIANSRITSTPSPADGLPVPQTAGLYFTARAFDRPPTTESCHAQQGRNCYSPLQLQTAYDMEPLYNAGLSGARTTIAIVDCFGSPTIRSDLAIFDRGFDLPPPPAFQIIHPAGAISPYSPSGADRVGWAMETSLDVEYAHAMAPRARILLVETPIDETVGLTGFPQIVKAENYVIDHHLADVITQSFGAGEATFPDSAAIRGLRYAFAQARKDHVTVIASSGDAGPTAEEDTNGNYFTHRVVSWPASDPLVTGVGGTQIHLDDTGTRTAKDNAWDDFPKGGGVAAGAGGQSTVFARPQYQNTVSSIVGKTRGVPDISMSSDPHGGAIVYTSFSGTQTGYHIIGGTSEAAPLFAGIVAIADQANGSPLGFVNPKLYKIGAGSDVLPDIKRGNTNVVLTQGGKTYDVPGFKALLGYDMATGLGTVDGAKLVTALTGSTL